jgi:hypothetical protein
MTIAIGFWLSSIPFRGTKAVNVTQNSKCSWLCRYVDHFFILHFLPNEMTFSNALHIAGANDKMNIVNFFHWSWRYTIWADNGRFLSGTRLFRDGPVTSGSLSVRQIGSWKPNGFNYEWAFKVPMQFFILLTGVMVFVFSNSIRYP